MRILLVVLLVFLCVTPSSAQDREYPRELFNTGATVSGTKPFPDYDPARLNDLFRKRREIELQMFDVINEAAVRRDPKIKATIDLYGDSLGYVPLLAVAHYKWAFGDSSQLDWLLAEDKKRGIGRDSLIITVFGYVDEWDKTIVWMKQNQEYNDKHKGAASGEVVSQAIEIRKKIYGADRFNKAWKAAKTK